MFLIYKESKNITMKEKQIKATLKTTDYFHLSISQDRLSATLSLHGADLSQKQMGQRNA